MADAASRVGGRRRSASLPPPQSMPQQPAPERAYGAAREDDAEVARLRAANAALEATNAVLEATVAARAGELSAMRAARSAHATEASTLRTSLRTLGMLCAVSSTASPALFLAVLARLAENQYATEVVRCVGICKDARSNAQLWERIVDLPHVPLVDWWRGPETRLCHWARVGDLARVRETLDRGAGVDAHETYGHTALWWASHSGHLAVVRELLDRGTDVDACTDALHDASGRGHTAVVLELAAHGADVSARDKTSWTPLMLACSYGHAATVAELLRLGADVNAVDNGGWSSLLLAAYGGHADAVCVLLAAPGVDVYLINADGRTALSLARTERRAAVVALLEAAGAH